MLLHRSMYNLSSPINEINDSNNIYKGIETHKRAVGSHDPSVDIEEVEIENAALLVFAPVSPAWERENCISPHRHPSTFLLIPAHHATNHS